MAFILNDGRVITAVRVKNSNYSNENNVIVDTGSDLSILPYSMVQHCHGCTLNQIITINIGGVEFHTMTLSGPHFEVDTEQHGGSKPAISQCCNDVQVHFLGLPTNPFVHFDGLLGMDMLDAFKVDPIKDLTGKKAYLANRVK
jgi:hypothetical protein